MSCQEKGKDKGNQTTELPVAGEKVNRNKEETQKGEEKELKTQLRKPQCCPERRGKKKVHTYITARWEDKGAGWKGPCGDL